MAGATELCWTVFESKALDRLLGDVDSSNAVDDNGMSALHYAAKHRREEAAALILAANPRLLHVQDSSGLTALHHAILSRCDAITALFFAANPELIHRTDSHGRTALLFAAHHNRSEIVEQLLDMDPALLKTVGPDGKTALDDAIDNGYWPVIVCILCVDPSLSSRVGPATALHHAAKHNYGKGVTKLLANYPEMINEVDHRGKTALHYAAQNGRVEVLSQLLAVASPRVIAAVDESGQTPFEVAVGEMNASAIKALMMSLSPDEVASVFLSYREEGASRELYLNPVLERQCECLLEVLHHDVAGTVYEYLGLKRAKQHKKKKLKTNSTQQEGVVE